MLNERGGIESDLTAIRLSDERYRLFVGTTSIKRDLTWLRRHRDANHRVTITDRTNDFAVLGLMGPSKAMIANAVGAARLNKLRYFQSGEAAIAGCPVLAARLSYAGEAGWEIICRTQDAHAIYDALHGAGARPAGLFAQTSMRIEKKFLAYGHDLDTDISPFEAGLDFAVAWETEFIGKSSLLSQHEAGYHRRIATLKFHDHDATPRHWATNLYTLTGESSERRRRRHSAIALARPLRSPIPLRPCMAMRPFRCRSILLGHCIPLISWMVSLSTRLG